MFFKLKLVELKKIVLILGISSSLVIPLSESDHCNQCFVRVRFRDLYCLLCKNRSNLSLIRNLVCYPQWKRKYCVFYWKILNINRHLTDHLVNQLPFKAKFCLTVILLQLVGFCDNGQIILMNFMWLAWKKLKWVKPQYFIIKCNKYCRNQIIICKLIGVTGV